LDYVRNGNRTRFESVYFGRRGRLNDLVLGECVTNSGKYMDAIVDGIWLICEESAWTVSAHLPNQTKGGGLADVTDPLLDLFAAETGAQMALVLYLLESKLEKVSPRIAERLRMEEKRRILDVFLKRDHPNWEGLDGKPHHLNNWNPWINSNVLMAVLLLETDVARRREMVLKCCKSVDAYLEDVSQDGACEEGPGYWARSAASVMECCTLLVEAHGGKGAEVERTAYLKAAGRYIANVHIAKGDYVDYGDSHMASGASGELVYQFGKVTNDPLLQSFGAYLSAEQGMLSADAAKVRGAVGSAGGTGSLARTLELVFVVHEMESIPKQDALTKDAWYPQLGLMTSRVREGTTDGFYVALQAASNGRSHAHNDSGSFLMFLDGEPVFIDVGVGQYTRQTFSADRYKIWTMQSAFHNLPTIGGVMQQEGDAFRAKVLEYKASDAATSIAVELASAYPKAAGVVTWKRTMTLDRAKNEVMLREKFQLGQPVPVAMSFLTMVKPELANDGVRVGKALLSFDTTALAAVVEKVDLQRDAQLEHSFHEGVWRVLVSSKVAVSEGDWRLRVSAL
jgi:hypothetical protein